MKKHLILLVLTVFFISCSSDDNTLQETQNRGSIEFDYDGERLLFGERSYTGWVLNEMKDTIAYFYESRILYGQPWKDQQRFTLYTYINNNQVTSFKVEFLPLQSKRGGKVYHNELPSYPLKFKNINFDGLWLNCQFEGKLYFYTGDTTDFVEFKSGKINIPLKGLDIPNNY